MSEITNPKTARVLDAIALRKPDRVPIFLQSSYLPVKSRGLSYQDAYYSQERYLEACRSFTLEYDPDLYFPADAPVLSPGPILDLFGTTQLKWPGQAAGFFSSHQFVEGEYMKLEEYDHFLSDPSDFFLRVYTPRVFSELAGFAKLPPLQTLVLGCYGAGLMAGCVAQPETIHALETILAAASTALAWKTQFSHFEKALAQAGQVSSHSAKARVPFDVISDMLRGMKGAMLDMFRVPDKLIAAQEKLYPMILAAAVNNARQSGNPRVFMPLHRGADGFMSSQQFEVFYWPYLKRLLQDLIDAGLTPMPFFEGSYDQRLEYLATLPKGKILGMFDRIDVAQAKAKLGNVMCISGGMPVAALQVGTPEQVKELTRNLIDAAGKDGGFIMGANSVLDEANPALVKIWVDYTKEYGQSS